MSGVKFKRQHTGICKLDISDTKGHDKTQSMIGVVGKFWHNLLRLWEQSCDLLNHINKGMWFGFKQLLVEGGECCVTSQIMAVKETNPYVILHKISIFECSLVSVLIFENITGRYFPVLYLNKYWNLASDYMPINETTK